jgi:hypothetical protein
MEVPTLKRRLGAARATRATLWRRERENDGSDGSDGKDGSDGNDGSDGLSRRIVRVMFLARHHTQARTPKGRLRRHLR